ncbi:MAG TPA: hypothetical protein DEB46_12585 [Myxococcales bacterium]|nr:hypothetical protein [Myxococcales bacterium]HBU49137.1 hypothetical protein [Myxococcales bacterium]
MPGLLLLLLSIPVTPQEAIRGFLRPDHGQQIAGLIRLETACAGARRHDFRDDPRLLKAVARLRRKVWADNKASRQDVLKALLRTQRCFSAAKLVVLLKPLLIDGDPALEALVVETLATTGDVTVIPALLARFQAMEGQCLAEGTAEPVREVCVWLAYGLGAALHQAATEDPLRAKVARQVAPWLRSPYRKVREVSVETLAAAGDSSAIEPLVELIKAERKNAFAEVNSSALLNRFELRLKTLKQRRRGSQ